MPSIGSLVKRGLIFVNLDKHLCGRAARLLLPSIFHQGLRRASDIWHLLGDRVGEQARLDYHRLIYQQLLRYLLQFLLELVPYLEDVLLGEVW